MSDEKKSLGQIVAEKFANFKQYEDQNSNAFIYDSVSNSIVYINTDKFKDLANSYALSTCNKILRKDQIEYVRNYMHAIACNSKKKIVNVSTRVRKSRDVIYYDLNTEDREIVKITKDDIEISNKYRVPFKTNPMMKEQVKPDLDTEPKQLLYLIGKHFIVKTKADLIVITVYIIACFIEDISKPVLCITGEKGSGKSTTLELAKRIVDPGLVSLQSLPKSTRDIAIIMAQSYFLAFDNIERINAEISNIICQGVTGGHFLTRALYTDDGLAAMNLKCSITINGITKVINKADLMDRSIFVEQKRIESDERKTDEEIFKEFVSDLSKILGGAFNALKGALNIVKGVKVSGELRLSDFEKWGIAISESLGISREEFLNAVKNNKQNASQALLMESPMAVAIFILMEDEEEWCGSVTELLNDLRDVAREHDIETNSKDWPASANSLSRKITELMSNFKDHGIVISKKNAGIYKKITITKK